MTFNVDLQPITPGVGSSDFQVNLDFTKLTQYASDSSAKPTNVDGYQQETW